MKIYYVYILTNKPQGTLYIGVTNDLKRRLYEHRNNLLEGFTQQYNLKKLVYCQAFATFYQAVSYEKQLKRWHRQWKINLIEASNRNWNDLYEIIFLGKAPETSSG